MRHVFQFGTISGGKIKSKYVWEEFSGIWQIAEKRERELGTLTANSQW